MGNYVCSLTVFKSYNQLLFLSDEGPTLETLDFTFHIGSTPTFSYFDLYLKTAYAAHYVYNVSLALKTSLAAWPESSAIKL